MKLILHKEIFNDVYLSSLDDYSKRYEVYYGGAGSGKSVFVAQKLVKSLNRPPQNLSIKKSG